MLTWAAQKIMGAKCARDASVVKRHEHKACPGRGAAFFMPLRRAGTVPNAGACYGPGSAKHHAAKSGVLHRARDTKGYLPRSFSSTSDEANPSAGVPIEA